MMKTREDSPKKDRLLRFKPQFVARALPDEGVFLLSEREVRLFDGKIIGDLVPHLAGDKSAAQIAAALSDEHRPEEVYYALEDLERRGVVSGLSPDMDLAQAAFWEMLGVPAGEAAARLARTRIALTAIDTPLDPALVEACESLGMSVDVTADPADHDLQVVLADGYLNQALPALNARNHERRQRWFLAQTRGTQLWLGPFFRHGHACWECLAHRLRLNRQIESYVERRSGAPRPLVTSMAHLPITLRFSADLVALEIAKWVADPALGNGGKITTIDLYTLESAQHHLIQRPQCPVCGDARLQERRLCRPPFAEGRRGIQPSGASTVMSPEQIIERFAHHISPITGTISRVVSVTTGIPSLYCYVAAFGFGRSSQNLTSLRHNLLSQASGTGRTDAQARAGAICEAIERFSGLHHGDEPALRASYRQVAADAIHPNACALYSDRQLAERAAWNALGSPFAIVPEPLDEDVPIDWTGVWSVSEGRFKLLPSTYLFYHYPQTLPGGYCYADSNGCAAGSSLEDAMLRGLMELTERDAVAIWWYNRLQAPAVDLASFGDPYFDWLVRLYASYNREVWVLDLTNDIGVPVFAALSRRTDKPVEDILVAFGAHVDPREGILRALCEMNHSLPAVLPIQADGSGEYGYPDKDQQHWWRTATVANQPYLLPRPGAPRLTRADYVSPPSATPVERCAELIDRLESLGLEVLMIDQTRPDIGLPVVKMIVPGLRHFWARFAPGRLYDVPVQMGWLARPLAEEDLNPIPMFV